MTGNSPTGGGDSRETEGVVAGSESNVLLAEYLDRLNAGESLDRERILVEHPGAGAGLIRDLEAFVGLSTDGKRVGELGILGDYRLLRMIGRGGMGVVYEAWQASMERRVALKVLPAGLAVDNRAFLRFMREAKTAGQLRHSSIVPVYGMGVESNTPYYAMEFIEGETLALTLTRLRGAAAGGGGKSEPPQAPSADSTGAPPEAGKVLGAGFLTPAYCFAMASVFADAADGLQHAHQMKVIHRDIKPSNLILDRTGRLLILDFGLARHADQETLTITGDLLGTVQYMSPEQAMARRIPVDHRTDIYSLGATLYEVVTGEPPFKGKDQQDTLSHVIFRDPRPPRRGNPSLPDNLGTIVLKCLEKDPEDRYGTAEALAQDLRRFARGDPIEARPPSRWEAVGRRLRRERVKLAVGAVCFLCLATSGLLAKRYLDDGMAASARLYEEKVVGAALTLEMAQETLLKSGHGEGEHWTWNDQTYTEAEDAWLERLGRARADLEEAIRILPDRADAHFQKARAERLVGRRDIARESLRSALRCDASFLPARILLEESLAEETGASTAIDQPGDVAARLTVKLALGSGDALVAAVDRWRYFKGPAAPPAGWNQPGFDDSSWLEGPAGIGYGDGDDATELDDMRNAYLAVFLRREFDAGDLSGIEELDLTLIHDDGALAYLNGEEVGRANMPTGPVGPATEAVAAIEAGATSLRVPVNRLRPGMNVLAVSVHNAGIDSSDLSFAAVLRPRASPVNITRTAPGWIKSWRDAHRALVESRWEDADTAYTALLEGVRSQGSPYLGLALEARLGRAHVRVQMHDYNGAIEDYAVAEELWPDLLQPAILMGKTYILKGEEERGDGKLEELWRRWPDPDEVVLAILTSISYDRGDRARGLKWAERLKNEAARARRRGEILMRFGRRDESLAEGKRAIQLDPLRAESHYMLANSYQDSGLHDLAIASYDEALRLEPSYLRAFYMRSPAKLRKSGDLEGVLNELRNFISHYPYDFDIRPHASYLREQVGDLDGAIAGMDAIIQSAPYHGRAYLRRGQLKFRQGRHDDAIADLDRAIQIDPHFQEAYHERGTLKGEKGDWNGAIADFDAITRRDPADIRGEFGRAWAAEKQGNLDVAIAELSRAMEKRPTESEARRRRAQAHLNRGDYARGEADLSEVLRLGPPCLEDYSHRGEARFRLADLDGAIADWTRAIEMDSGKAQAWVNRGIGWSNKGEHTNAVADFTKAIELQPWIGLTYLDRGGSRLRLDDVPGAIADTESGLWRSFLKEHGEPVAPDLYNLACTLSLLASRSEKANEGIVRDPLPDPYVEQALEALRRAFEAGYRDSDWIATDPDWAHLQDLPGFQELLREFFPSGRPSCRSVDRQLVQATLVPDDAEWRYLRGKAEPSPALEWTGLDFDDGAWERGAVPLGYGFRGLKTVIEGMQGGHTTVYLRHDFLVADPAGIRGCLALRVRSYFGCVVYLNGAEAGRVRAGEPGARLPFDATAEPHTNSNSCKLPIHASLLVPGRNVLAIQALTDRIERPQFSIRASLLFDAGSDLEEDEKLRERLRAGEPRAGGAVLAYLDGRIRERQGDAKGAMEEFARAIAEDPRRPEPHLRLARGLIATGETAAAETRLRQALEGGVEGGAALWDLWLEIALADRKLEAAAALAVLPTASGTDPLGLRRRDDIHWLLEEVAKSGTIRIDCGSVEDLTVEGAAWGRDRFFTGGYLVGEATAGDAIDRTGRWLFDADGGPTGYRIPLPHGDYEVELRFSNLRTEEAGRRVFDVFVEDQRVLEAHEPFKEGLALDVRSFETRIEDGALDIEFIPRLGVPILSGIEIHRLAD